MSALSRKAIINCADLYVGLYAERVGLHCVTKNEPTLASCSFIKHRLILIILGKQHRHTFENYMHIQLFLSLHFCLLYLLLNNCDGNDAKHHAFSSVDCWWL